MPTPLFNIDPLIPFLNKGTTVLTPNNRLANKIQQAWGIHLEQQGSRSWHLPKIYAIENWAENLWQQLQNIAWPNTDVATLDPFQELLLWEQVIQEDRDKPALLYAAGLAAAAQRAWQLLQQWQLSPNELINDNDASAQFLRRWGLNYEQKLGELGAITRTGQIAHLCEALASGALPRVERIVLVGFQTRTPLYDTLLNAAAEDCTPLITAEHSASCCWQVAVKDSRQELESAALWASQILQQSSDYQNQDYQNQDHQSQDHQSRHCRIGIIVPDLALRRETVERIFRERLEPDYHLPHHERRTAPFNISTATPLADACMVNTALQLLQLNRRDQSLDYLCQLLQSPFWGNADVELPGRARAETRLRRLAKLQFRTTEFREICAKSEGDGGDMGNRLEQIESLRRQAPAKASYQHWRHLFERQLDTLGWPGKRALDSVEYQQREHWLQLLERFASLDTLASNSAKKTNVSLESALNNLRRLAQNTPFQAESDDSPLQILGLLEGAGLRFTHLWMAGMDDRQWPPPPSPNPLLPLPLQRKYNMPRASADRELELARDLLASYRSNTDQVVFSRCQFDGDSELSPSPLIASICAESLSGLLGTEDTRTMSDMPTMQCPQLQTVDLSTGPELRIKPAKTPAAIRGGSAILKDQAACPFNAFARWRLGAQQAMEPGNGLTPLDRGILLHACLDQLWGELNDSLTLTRLDDNEINTLLGAVVDNNLRPWKARKWELGDRFFQLERERLIKLLAFWLSFEKQRAPFEVIAREALLEGDFAGLPLSLRIDRIDRTPNGETILIDYKTGLPSLNSWLGERPSEPQLPLYALMQNPPPCAISFAVINIEQQRFIGIAQDDKLLPEPPAARGPTAAEWPELLEQWRTALTALATEYGRGHAALAVYNKNSFDLQQELLPLNRWPEREQITYYLQQHSQLPAPEQAQ